jgi:CheY-like chemotaxis protein
MTLQAQLKTKLRILLVEDDVADAELIEHQLNASGFTFSLTRVQTENDFRHELEVELPDLILSDHGLPSFSGFKALEITRAEYPDLPFIFVSGSNDQGMVAHMHDEGATDYVFKRDLADLKAAIQLAFEPQPAPTSPTSTTPVIAQPELKLQLPPLPTNPAVFIPPAGRLAFCPHCRQASDESGRVVPLEIYCANHAEIIVLRQVCPDCERSSLHSAARF